MPERFSRVGLYLILGFLAMALIVPQAGWACSLWAAAGEKVSGGGVLVAKNRDATPKYDQVLVLQKPEGGYRFYGVYEKGNEDSGIKMGINQKGLVVASASAIIMPAARKTMERTSGLNRLLLTHCATVEEALKRKDLMKGARFLVLADSKEAALVSIGIDGSLAIERTQNGVLFKTNHFTDPSMVAFNPTEFTEKRKFRFENSQARYARLKELLAGGTVFDLAGFEKMSGDTVNGPQNSIWRNKGEGTKVRTLSSWVVWLLPGAEPKIFVRLADEGKPVDILRPSFKDVFTD